MTHLTINRPDNDVAREARTPVRMPAPMGGMFQGWGPKF
jgi:hypothetical protein